MSSLLVKVALMCGVVIGSLGGTVVMAANSSADSPIDPLKLTFEQAAWMLNQVGQKAEVALRDPSAYRWQYQADPGDNCHNGACEQKHTQDQTCSGDPGCAQEQQQEQARQQKQTQDQTCDGDTGCAKEQHQEQAQNGVDDPDPTRTQGQKQAQTGECVQDCDGESDQNRKQDQTQDQTRDYNQDQSGDQSQDQTRDHNQDQPKDQTQDHDNDGAASSPAGGGNNGSGKGN